MTFSLKQIADLLKISIPQEHLAIEIAGFSSLEFAKKGDLSFFSDTRYTQQLYSTQASVVFVPQHFSSEKKLDTILLPVEDPKESINQLLLQYQKMLKKPKDEKEPHSFIHPNAQLGKSVFVGAFSYISENVKIGDETQIHQQVYIGKNVKIGKGCIISAGVKIYDNTQIGNNVEIDMNAVVGSKGFGYIKQKDGTYEEVPQVGYVVLEDNVHIGASTTIDRAMMGKTIVHQGTKVDNQVQIAHNVMIGENTIICSQTGVAGSTKVGKNVIIAGKVGIADHLNIAEGITILAMSGVHVDLNTPNIIMAGMPAVPYMQDRKQVILNKKLPDTMKRIEELEKNVNKLLENHDSK